MHQATKKPVTINCFQFTYRSIVDRAWPDWFQKVVKTKLVNGQWVYYIPTLEGDLDITINDVIIQGVMNEVYPCKPYIFQETYDFNFEVLL